MTNEESSILQSAVLYIIGPNNFSNELLHEYLCQELDIPCRLEPDIECIQDDNNGSTIENKVVLFDTYGKNLENVFLEFNGFVKEVFPFIILAFYNLEADTGFEIEALRYGAKGFFYSHESLELLKKGICSMVQGELWVSRELLSECIMEDMNPNPLSNLCMARSSKDVLSRRETEILALVSVGAKNLEIAHKLFISPHTVKTHLYNIYKKIHVGDRLQAVRWAAKNFQY